MTMAIVNLEIVPNPQVPAAIPSVSNHQLKLKPLAFWIALDETWVFGTR
jgi:hypothetical protein